MAPGSRVERRGSCRAYLAMGKAESQEAKSFLTGAISEAPFLKEKLVSKGGTEMRRVQAAHRKLSASLRPARVESARDLAALITSASEYTSYSSAIHSSVAGYNEFRAMHSDPNKRAPLVAQLIFGVARSNGLVAAELVRHVSGGIPRDLERQLRAISKRMGFAEDDLLPPYPRPLHAWPGPDESATS